MKTFASLASMASFALLTMALESACSTSTVHDEGPVKEPVGEISEGISKLRVSIDGALAYGETSAPTAYKGFPSYSAFELTGDAGDELEVWVKSNDGDPVGWLVDEKFRILAWNDDVSRSDTNAHLRVTLSEKASGKHYVVVREYWFRKMTFEVTLGGNTTAPSVDCNVDADCVRIEKGCCDVGEYIAVPKKDAAAYRARLHCEEPLYCPLMMIVDDHSVAQCNELAHKCEIVKPKDIECLAFSTNPHGCPAGWQCRQSEHIADAPGTCVQQCAGFAGLSCSTPDDQCLDDPRDDCNPNAGGADCGGICVGKNDDCRVKGCSALMICAPCRTGTWSCVPQGGGC